MQRNITLLFFILTFSISAHAETRYVTDHILVTLRPAPNDTAPPLEQLATGTAVEVIEDLGAFIKIKSATGKAGYARSKYFINSPTAATNLNSNNLQTQLTTALKRNSELTAELQQLKSTSAATDHPELMPELEKSRKALDDLSKRYQHLEQSQGDNMTLIRERDQLKAELSRLSKTNKEEPPSKTRTRLQWFFAGGVLLLTGWFAGRSYRPKRRL